MSLAPRASRFFVSVRKVAIAAVLGSVVVGLGAGTANAQSHAVYRWGSYKTVGQGVANDQHVPTAVPGLTGVTALAAANSANYALLGNGQEWAWGNGSFGQLGDNSRANSAVKPVQVQFPSGTVVKAMGEAQDMAFAVDSQGQGWAWGWNGRGTLCLGHHKEERVPTKVPGLSNLVAVTGGGGTVVWLTASGAVYTCGFQLTGNFSTPHRVTGLPVGDPVVAISNGNAYSTVLLQSGQVWDWGLGGAGQLGNGSAQNSSVPVQVQLPGGTHAVQVYAGGDLGNDGHQLALLNTGAVVAWGSNLCGQLGAGRPKKETIPVSVQVLHGLAITDVVAGGSTSYVTDSTGKVWAWGSNKGGQVRSPSSRCVATPTVVDSGVTLLSATASDVMDYHG
jgi:alpha-tubulin suppressor-like RCC1 family protein